MAGSVTTGARDGEREDEETGDKERVNEDFSDGVRMCGGVAALSAISRIRMWGGSIDDWLCVCGGAGVDEYFAAGYSAGTEAGEGQSYILAGTNAGMAENTGTALS